MFLFVLGILFAITGIAVGFTLSNKAEVTEGHYAEDKFGNYKKDENGNRIYVEATTTYPYKKFTAVAIAIGLVVGLLFGIFSMCKSVPTGHTGVITVFGNVKEETLDSGFHFRAPWEKVIKMDNRVQKSTTTLCCFSSDIQEVTIQYTLNYQINKQTASNIYRTIGKDYAAISISPTVAEAVKVVTATYTAEQLVGRRAELAEKIEVQLKADLEKYNIELVSTAIEDMDFTDEFTNAVEAKQVAAQAKLKAEIEQEQAKMAAEYQKEIAAINAAANAEVAKIQAEADMEVAKIGADSAAYQGKREAAVYMQKLGALNGWSVVERVDENENTIFTFVDSTGKPVNGETVALGTNSLIKQGYIDKWNGELPIYYLSDDNSLLLSISD